MGAIKQVIDASEDVLALLGVTTANPQQGATALALALVRVCRHHGVDLDEVLRLAKRADDTDDEPVSTVRLVRRPK